MSQKLLSIAKRQFRKGAERQDISDLVNLADQLQIEELAANTSASELVERAEKEVARESVRARKVTFRMLLENRDRNRNHEGNSERDDLFSEIVAALQSEFPSFETVYARNIANLARAQFDVGIEGRPIERIAGPLDSAPLCSSCHVSRADAKRLNLENCEITPMCHDCSSQMLRDLR